MIHDHIQRQQALDSQQSFIVQAPAGSGKTELLTQRLLNLLTTVDSAPEEVLAITFTRKAASEMRHRVIASLQLAQQEKPDTPHLATTWEIACQVQQKSEALGWDLLNNPNRLRIQTIDAFCASLIRQMPMLSQLGAAPQITEMPNQAYQAAAEAIIATLEQDTPWQEALATLLLHVDNNLVQLRGLFVAMLSHREQWLPHVVNARHQQDLKLLLEANLRQAIERDLKHAVDLFPHGMGAELLALYHYAQGNLGNTVDLSQLPNATLDDLSIWQDLARFLLTTNFTWRKTVTIKNGFPAVSHGTTAAEKTLYKESKQRMLNLLAEFTSLAELREALETVTHLPSAEYTPQQWQVLTALLQLLPVLVAELQVSFAQSGSIDFVELGQRALLALGDDDAPTDLALYLDYKLKHILIDEFQDTSVSQFRLLEKLTHGWQPGDGRSLFLVGDPMQSIYRFRAAEVGLFLRAKHYGIGHIQLTSLLLSSNFRSTPAVVDWVNHCFAHVFPATDAIAEGAISYHASTAVKQASSSGAILYQHDTDHAQQAQTIVDIIQAQPESHSVAILVKSRRQLLDIIPCLRKHGIHYQAVDIETLAHLPCIQDLLSLTCALLHPADRLAWLSVLRSPYCGLVLADLHAISDTDARLPIWSQLNQADVLAQLSDDGQTRVKQLLPIINHFIAQRQRTSLRQWVSGVWLALQGGATLTQQHDLVNIERFFHLLDTLEKRGQPITRGLLERELTTLYAQPTADNQVKLMTIHKSKGLEFDTVIVPALQQRTQTDKDKLLLWLERPGEQHTSELLLAPIAAKQYESDPIYCYLKRQQQQKADYETARLLYVAATRAKSSLHLLADIPDSSETRKPFVPAKGSFLAKLWGICQEDFIEVPVMASAKAEITAPQFRRLAASYQMPTALAALLPKPSVQQQTANNPVWRDPSAAIIGTTVHAILQQMSQLDVSQWPSIFQRPWHKQLRNLGLPEKQLPMALQRIYDICQTLQQSKTAHWILSPHPQAQSEYAVKYREQGMVKQVVFDRIFEDKGEFWVIDYKTSEQANVQTAHEQQLRRYQQVLAQITALPIRCGLYFPLCDALIEPLGLGI